MRCVAWLPCHKSRLFVFHPPTCLNLSSHQLDKENIQFLQITLFFNLQQVQAFLSGSSFPKWSKEAPSLFSQKSLSALFFSAFSFSPFVLEFCLLLHCSSFVFLNSGTWPFLTVSASFPALQFLHTAPIILFLPTFNLREQYQLQLITAISMQFILPACLPCFFLKWFFFLKPFLVCRTRMGKQNENHVWDWIKLLEGIPFATILCLTEARDG